MNSIFDFIDGFDSVIPNSVGVIRNYSDSAVVADRSRDNKFYDENMLDYLLNDIIKEKAVEAQKTVEKQLPNLQKIEINKFIDSIDKVIFDEQNGATIVRFKNGEKSVVVCQRGDKFDKEKGLALALLKYQFGNIGYYNTIFKKFIDEI